MGAADSENEADSDEKPQHRVRITKPFYLGKSEVTVGQFRKFVDDSDYKTEAESDGKGSYGPDLTSSEYDWRETGWPQGEDNPVVNISWNDATEFCQWLSRKEGRDYRLPTEAEWEYACRAGTTTRYSFGGDPEGLAAFGNVYSKRDSRIGGTAPACSFRENPWGLHDMHANVFEWCQDWYGEYASGTASDPTGPSKGLYRVNRGGSSLFPARYCRSAQRLYYPPDYRSYYLGFRVALDPES